MGCEDNEELLTVVAALQRRDRDAAAQPHDRSPSEMHQRRRLTA
jgi:hypothetical protein